MKKKRFIRLLAVSLLFCILTSLTVSAKSRGLRNICAYKENTIAIGTGGVYRIHKNKKISLTLNIPAKKIVHAHNNFFVIDYNGNLYSSDSGSTWEQRNLPEDISMSAITYYKGHYIIADHYGTLYSTTDFNNFEKLYDGFMQTYPDCSVSELITHRGRLFTILDNFLFKSPVLYTTDFVNWKTIKERKNIRYNSYKKIGKSLYVLGVNKKQWKGNILRITTSENRIKTRTIRMRKGKNVQDIIRYNKKLLVLSNNLKNQFATKYYVHRLKGRKTKLIKKASSRDGGSRFYLNKKLYIVGYNRIRRIRLLSR